ncbi:quinone oxidoreductase family protein [Nocardia aurantia]|uniref:Mycocerosic acid synthase n=1 Tax=Nocardia aurantia TaxID=2585199 RepID=A0A7K0DS73_9NOCA|nr:zinc-binding dehydrogenase [Nocardia aurantia]MQY28448.1 Mycocerosic acid synthase [Nocardia aurantia]
MRAVVMSEPFDGPDRTRVLDIEVPRPGPGQVAIDVEYAGLNFLDIMARRGDPGYAPAWPYVPGLEVVGAIRELAEDVVGLAVGERVVAFTRGGGLAEVAVADAALVASLPAAAAPELAAAAPLALSSAFLLLNDVARIRAGERLLMHSAAGGIGSAVAQLAPLFEVATAIGTVGRAQKIDEARRSGWPHVFARDEELTEAVGRVAGGAVDVVLDPLGTAMLDPDLDLAAPGGRIVLFGNPAGGKPAPLPPLPRLIGGNVGIVGFSMSRLTATAPHRAAAALRRVLELVAAGQLSVPITTIESLDEVREAHQLLAEGRGTGKFVVAVDQSRRVRTRTA